MVVIVGGALDNLFEQPLGRNISTTVPSEPSMGDSLLHTYLLEQTTTSNILTMPLILELDGGGWLFCIVRDHHDNNNIKLLHGTYFGRISQVQSFGGR
jgi:hypothetical protein